MCKLASNLQQKFIHKKLLSGVDSESLVVDIYFEENRKALQFVDIGTKTKSILNKQTHQLKIAQNKLEKFRKDCLNFCLYTTTHLLDRLPFHVPVINLKSSPLQKKQLWCSNAVSNLYRYLVSVLTYKLKRSLTFCHHHF